MKLTKSKLKAIIREEIQKLDEVSYLNEKVDSKKLKNDPFHQWVTGSGKLTKFKDEIHDIIEDIMEYESQHWDNIPVTSKFMEDIDSVDGYDYFKDPELKAEALKKGFKIK